MSTSGELVGHRDLVSGFSFCQHDGQRHVCVSSSSDGSVRFWDAAGRVLIREHAAHQVSDPTRSRRRRKWRAPASGGEERSSEEDQRSQLRLTPLGTLHQEVI